MSKPKRKLSKGARAFRLVVSIVTTIVVLFLFSVAVIAIVQRAKNDTPSFFGYYMFTVLSDSMEPTLVVGDVILSKKVDSAQLKEGDIVTYKKESGPLSGHNITHRILKIEDGYVYTMGDKENAEPDPPILARKVTTVMVKKLVFISKMIGYLKTPQGFVVVFVVPLVSLLILIFVSYYFNELKARKTVVQDETVTENKLSEQDLELLTKLEKEAKQKKDSKADKSKK